MEKKVHMDSTTPKENPARRALLKSHRFFQKTLVQVAVVVVGLMTTMVTGYGIVSGQGIFFLPTQAQNIAKSLVLRGGEQGLVTCDGKMGGSWLDPKTQRQLRITCTPNSTSQPTAKPTLLPSIRPTSTPSIQNTPVPTSHTGMTPMPTGSTGSAGGANAVAFGVWKPWVSVVTGKVVDTCSKEIHDKYYVIGPDGKKYPTWHPPVDPTTNCTFGHEHGMEPSKYVDWKLVKAQYAFDGTDACPKDGKISDCEINAQHSGIPFGYANETYSAYQASHGFTAMRHESHEGHKVQYYNDVQIDQGDPAGTGSPNNRYDTGVRCNFFGKVHMGVSSADAFANNLHEVMMFKRCTDGVEYRITRMAEFGAAGQFLAPCIGTARENRAQCGSSLVNVGFTNTSSQFPGTCQDGERSILDRACLNDLIFVSPGKFSGNLYEEWNTNMSLLDTAGKTIVYDNLGIDVNDSIRHYDPSKPNSLGYNVDLCNQEPTTGDKKFRGGFCDTLTKYHTQKAPSWDDPKALNGTNRGTYMAHPFRVVNAGKSAYKISDPYGRATTETTLDAVAPVGMIKQYVSTVTFEWSAKFKGTLMPNNFNTVHDDGNGTVHAPN